MYHGFEFLSSFQKQNDGILFQFDSLSFRNFISVTSNPNHGTMHACAIANVGVVADECNCVQLLKIGNLANLKACMDNMFT